MFTSGVEAKHFSFAEFLRDRREVSGLKQQQVAKLTAGRISSDHLSALECGKKDPTEEEIDILSIQLKIGRWDKNLALLLADFPPKDWEIKQFREEVLQELFKKAKKPVLISDYTGRIFDGNSGGLDIVSFTNQEIRDAKPYLIELLLNPELHTLPGWDQHLQRHITIFNNENNSNNRRLKKNSWYSNLLTRLLAIGVYVEGSLKNRYPINEELTNSQLFTGFNELGYPVYNEGRFEVKVFQQITVSAKSDPRFQATFFIPT